MNKDKNHNTIKTFRDKTNQEILDSINPELLEKARDKIKNMSEKSRNELKTSISWFFLPDSLKKATREKIQSKLKFIDMISLIVATIGIITNLFASSLYISFKEIRKGNSITIEIIPQDLSSVYLLRMITSITTVILIGLIIWHYICRLNFQIFKQRLEVSDGLWSSGLFFKLVFEILLCLIHTPPFLVNKTVSIMTSDDIPQVVNVDWDLIITSIISLRVYLYFRYYSFYSPWADDKAEKVCNDCNAIGGISFAVKAELKERPYIVVGVLMSISIFIFGYALRNIEVAFILNMDQSKYQDWIYIWNGFWCIIITILTVGYGDFYPQTHLGRFICVIACLWGTFLISLMVVSLTLSVEFTPQEEKAYEELKNNEISFQLRVKAARIIRTSHLLKIKNDEMRKENSRSSKMEYVKVYNDFKSQIDDFRILRKNVITKEHEVSAETILHKLNNNVTEQMERMIHHSNYHVTSLMDYIKLSKDIQGQISECSDRLETLVKGLYGCIKTDE